MSSMNNRKVQNSKTPMPGCLGRMVNLFDINTVMIANKQLMDKPHYDGISLSRSRSDVARSGCTVESSPLEDKVIVSELRRNASNRTPMKMLIDHEISKEMVPKQNPPNLVAKLMGLDALPRQLNDSVVHHSQSKVHGTSSSMHSEQPLGYEHRDNTVSDRQWKPEANYQEHKEYNDIYEIGKQGHGEKFVNNISPQKSRHTEEIDEKKMALVRQKFAEAKHLVTDDKLRQTKAFHDALEVLSSNRDLFLKCLQEPSSPFTQQLYKNYATPVTPETKRITVLKPSRSKEHEKPSESEYKNEKQVKIPLPVAMAHGRSKSIDERSSTVSYWDNDSLPTRIVVLKPGIVNAHEIGTVGSPDSSSFKSVYGEHYFNETEEYDAHESREVAKEITRQMREKLVGPQSDETLLSSMFSNGYTGDESSINKSDNEYDGVSDSEVISPTSRHSWDYINRFSSPFSSSSFSRASCSPESSVCREAKKRLSERWAMVALHGNPSEQRHVRRSSSTLGEMLALSDTHNLQTFEEVGNQENNGSTPCMRHDLAKDHSLLDDPRSLLRSKSVPVSSSVYGDRLNVELSGPELCKPDESREEAKPKSTKTSFKGKVSSFFFSKNKKVKKASSSTSETENLPGNSFDTSELRTGVNSGRAPKLAGRENFEERIKGQSGAIVSSEARLPVWRPARSNDSHDQPSPSSVLDTPFGLNDSRGEFASSRKQDQGGQALARQLKSSLIDKSPPIGSISRTISWKDSCSDTTSMFSVAPLVTPLEPESEEDWFLLVQTLLADSGINDEVQSDAFFTRWHSADSPLDPMLREKYINMNNKALSYEANRRQWRSRRKLMYDCVNAALADVTHYRLPEVKHRQQVSNGVSSEAQSPLPLTEAVWTRIKEWIAYDAGRIVGGDGDSNNSAIVEMVVKNAVVGKRWAENMLNEIDKVGKGIEAELFEELVQDAVIALAGKDS